MHEGPDTSFPSKPFLRVTLRLYIPGKRPCRPCRGPTGVAGAWLVSGFLRRWVSVFSRGERRAEPCEAQGPFQPSTLLIW